MVALHDLCRNFLFFRQMICKQHIILNHVFFRYESNLEPVTIVPNLILVMTSLVEQMKFSAVLLSAENKVSKESDQI